MLRPGFTIETKLGINYDANHICYSWNQSIGWVISFICSGTEAQFPANEIKEIRFSSESCHYCNECDQPLLKRSI